MKDSKFSGEIKKDIMDTICMYEICLRQCSLPGRLKSDFFIHAFQGTARPFLMDSTTPRVPFLTMCAVIDKEDKIDARKLQIKTIK